MKYKPQVVPPTLNGTELTFTEIVKNLHPKSLSVNKDNSAVFISGPLRIADTGTT